MFSSFIFIYFHSFAFHSIYIHFRSLLFYSISDFTTFILFQFNPSLVLILILTFSSLFLFISIHLHSIPPLVPSSMLMFSSFIFIYLYSFAFHSIYSHHIYPHLFPPHLSSFIPISFMVFTSYRISIYFIAISCSHLNPDVKLIYFHLFPFIYSHHIYLHLFPFHLCFSLRIVFQFISLQSLVLISIQTLSSFSFIYFHSFAFLSHLSSFMVYSQTIVHFISFILTYFHLLSFRP